MEDLALMLRSAVPIDDIDQLMISPTDGLAVVWVNISERPDLNVLAARHDEEGSGFCICTFFYGNLGKSNMLIGLRVEMRQPTRTIFHLALKVQQYLDQLPSLVTQARSGSSQGDTYPQPRVRIVALVACGQMSHLSK